ncbi:uncharacterized protein NPIL_131811 [Nephila pilipes]|uniref:CWH43-like N-terminal domain-containing protein n=1 Tax=Nephila pilipes TaxID=299642 RepID=A0A8X6QGA5_NEPPI|nr:uncharacterized protein NPIL_131811 [Nephila pilipes]
MLETGDVSYQRIVFTIGIILVGILASKIMLIRYLLQKYFFDDEKSHWRTLNSCCYALGLFSVAFLIMVIAFPARSEVTPHTVVAAIFFVGILLYTCFDCYLFDHVVQTHSLIDNTLKKVQMGRICFCVGQLIFCFLYLVIYPAAQERWSSQNKKLPAMKTPEDAGFLLMFTACLFEWLAIISLISYFTCFAFDFSYFYVTLQAIPRNVSRPSEYESGSRSEGSFPIVSASVERKKSGKRDGSLSV